MNKEQLHKYIKNNTGNESNICQIYALKGDETVYDDCWHGFKTNDDKNTSIHLADVRAEYPGKHTCIEHSAIMENGQRVWTAYETLFVDGEDFIEIGKDFETLHAVNRVKLGKAELRLMKQRELVDFAVEWIEKNRK